MSLTAGNRPAPLATPLGVLAVRGPEAAVFLQGQLSNDLNLLQPQSVMLASCSSAQGRVQAVMTLIDRGEGELWLLLPRRMVDSVRQRLQKYVLRSKVKLENMGARLTVSGLEHVESGDGTLAEARSLPRLALGEHRVVEGGSLLRWPGSTERYLLIEPSLAGSGPSTSAAATAAAIGSMPMAGPAPHDRDLSAVWRLADIRAGLPQVYPETHESFVAQMLNLDLLNGISFTKGCYTGQEIIARMHYRGTVKRRMLLFSATAPPPAPGAKVVSGHEPAGEVVDAASTPEGCELLAVVSLTLAEQSLTLETDPRPLVGLDLPYSLEG